MASTCAQGRGVASVKVSASPLGEKANGQPVAGTSGLRLRICRKILANVAFFRRRAADIFCREFCRLALVAGVTVDEQHFACRAGRQIDADRKARGGIETIEETFVGGRSRPTFADALRMADVARPEKANARILIAFESSPMLGQAHGMKEDFPRHAPLRRRSGAVAQQPVAGEDRIERGEEPCRDMQRMKVAVVDIGREFREREFLEARQRNPARLIGEIDETHRPELDAINVGEPYLRLGADRGVAIGDGENAGSDLGDTIVRRGEMAGLIAEAEEHIAVAVTDIEEEAARLQSVGRPRREIDRSARPRCLVNMAIAAAIGAEFEADRAVREAEYACDPR